MNLNEYVKNISNAASTILEGMAVTFSHLFREPITIQYPDKTDRPVTEMLPPRYRGLLEVQMDICTGCKRCERACPIEVIAIDLVKNPETKKQEMSRFDIDMGKCMFCGLCVEACNAESTGAIRHTREFEGAGPTLDSLVFRFIPEGTAPLYKAPKDASEIPVGEYGPHAREARERAMRDNPALLEELRAVYREQNKGKAKAKTGGGKKKGVAKLDAAKTTTIKQSVVTTGKTDVTKFAALLENLTAQTDCGACGYPTCREYTTAMASGKDMDASKCEPGGAEATADLSYAMHVAFRGPDVADKFAAVEMPPVVGDAPPPGAAPAAPTEGTPAPAEAPKPA